MTKKMKVTDVRELFSVTQLLAQPRDPNEEQLKMDPKFYYAAVVRTRAKLLPEVKGINENLTKIVADYEKERMEAVKKFAEKDDKGNPILLPNNRYKLGANAMAFHEAANALKEKHKDALKAVDDFLVSEIEVEIHQVSQDIVPHLGGPELEALKPLIVELNEV